MAMGQDSMDDEWGGDVVDDELQRAFSAAYPERYEANAAYDELRPTFVATRRRQLVRQGAFAAAAVALIALGGPAVLGQLSSSDGDENLIAGPASQEDVEQVDAAESSQSTLGSPVSSTQPDGSGAGQAASDPAESASPSPGVSPTNPPATQPEAIDPPSIEASSTIPPPTAPAPTTTATTTSGPSPTVYQADCGTVSYTVDGRDLTLVDAAPSGAGEADIKSSGPEKIEVSFEEEGSPDHCEVKIEWKRGSLVASAENESE
jgi:hypothetical protein